MNKNIFIKIKVDRTAVNNSRYRLPVAVFSFSTSGNYSTCICAENFIWRPPSDAISFYVSGEKKILALVALMAVVSDEEAVSRGKKNAFISDRCEFDATLEKIHSVTNEIEIGKCDVYRLDT